MSLDHLFLIFHHISITCPGNIFYLGNTSCLQVVMKASEDSNDEDDLTVSEQLENANKDFGKTQ